LLYRQVPRCDFACLLDASTALAACTAKYAMPMRARAAQVVVVVIAAAAEG